MPLSREQFDSLRAKGLSVEQIVRFEKGETGQTLAPTPAAPVPAPRQPSRPMPATLASHPLFWAAQQGYDLPTMLGAPGGFIPGPVGRGVSAAGGAGGSIIQQLMRTQSVDPSQVLRDALGQTALTTGGQMLGGASRAVGTGLMRTALRPRVGTTRTAPGVVKNALEQGATVRRVAGTGGEQKAAEVLGKRGAVTAAGIERVDRQGIPLGGGATARVRVQMSRMIPPIDDVVAGKSSKMGKDRAEARRVIDEMIQSYQKPQTLADVKAITQQLDDEARAIYETAIPSGKNLRFNDKGVPVGELVPIEARIKFGTAHRLRRFMQSTPESATGIPGGLKAAEAATSKAIGVRKAIKDATVTAESGIPSWFPQGFGRGSLALGGGAIGASQGDNPKERIGYGLAGTAIGGALADPSVTSRLAHLFYQQYVLPALLRQSPRAGFMLFNGGEMPPDTLRNQ